MGLYTYGFKNSAALLDHLTRHGALCGVSTAAEYDEKADAFCGAPLDPANKHIHECRRRGGDRIRYNETTQEWGVLGYGNVIRTYYILTTAIAKHGSGLVYFNLECAK